MSFRVWPVSSSDMALRQGDLRLLEREVARRLLASMIPARFAYVAGDGTPRVVATWFHWTGEVARIDLHPTRVGVLDFQTRLPSALGGIS